MSRDLTQRISVIEEKEDYRISTIFKNLLNLQKSGRGVVFVCGALHAENLISKFKQKGMQDQVLYYFPHSKKSYYDNFDDVKELLSNDTLANRTFCLSTEQERTLFEKTVVKEIKLNNVNYKREIIAGNSHTKFLSRFFNKDFKAYLRPGYHVDALLDVSNKYGCEGIIKKLADANVSTNIILLEGKKHLVIRDVNKKKNADNIRRLN